MKLEALPESGGTCILKLVAVPDTSEPRYHTPAISKWKYSSGPHLNAGSSLQLEAFMLHLLTNA